MTDVLIIGGKGFVGTSLVGELDSQGVAYAIGDIGIEASEGEQLHCDVRDYKSLLKLPTADCIVNLAAVHRDDVRPRTLYHEVNVEGAKNVCRLARERKASKIIFTSSVAIYGFAPPGTSEDGHPNYFNEYGRTKFLAEQVYNEWLMEDPRSRSLVIVRPTVIFGEGNRGNVYNLCRQIASRKFVMVGGGDNVKSMAYVGNVAAFLNFSRALGSGRHVYNYVDSPELSMNQLVANIKRVVLDSERVGFRVPYIVGYLAGLIFDGLALITGKKFSISSIRVKKFASTTQFASAVSASGFTPRYTVLEGLQRTLAYEFLEDNSHLPTFDTE